MMSYDQIHDLLTHLQPPAGDGTIKVEWLVPATLAIGRDRDGRYILVMVGAPVAASSDVVRRAVATGTWMTTRGETINATLLRLPHGEPFHIALTTIVVEFFRHQIETRAVCDVFLEVQSFIELIIRRVLLPPEVVLGLLGELLVLDFVVAAAQALPESKRPALTSLWRGHSRQSRDIVFNQLAFEIKTTSGASSRHHIGGLDQIEPRIIDGDATEALYLVSVGLREEPAASGGRSVALLVERILARLPIGERQIFLDQLKQYGPEDCSGYEHKSMATWAPYTRRYDVVFEPRVYDMSDPNLKLIRRSNLQDTCVLPLGISYQIDLPESVPGSHGKNPRRQLRATIKTYIEAHA